MSASRAALSPWSWLSVCRLSAWTPSERVRSVSLVRKVSSVSRWLSMIFSARGLSQRTTMMIDMTSSTTNTTRTTTVVPKLSVHCLT